MASIQIINRARAKISRASFCAIAEAALPKGYELSVAFVDAAAMKKMNLMYRGTPKPTDILSFPLEKKEGEIYICPSEARKEAPKFGRSYQNFLLFLFIHGCAHLKGYDHSATMERIEADIRRKFKV